MLNALGKDYDVRASIQQLSTERPLVGAEIGVHEGYNAYSILNHLNIKKLYLIDPYVPYDWSQTAGEYGSKEAEDKAKKLLEPFHNKIEWLKMSSDKAVNFIPDNHLDFVYIDGDHTHKQGKSDILNWHLKVKNGGMVAGHDFFIGGIRQAILELYGSYFDTGVNDEKIIVKNDGIKDWWHIKKDNDDIKRKLSALEQDVVIGTFTHRDTYIGKLKASVDKYLPGIEFLSVIEDGPININMERLRQKFLKTGKRFWVFLDDDIQFLDSDIIRKAVYDLLTHRFGLIGVYSTYDPNYILGSDNLECKELGWVPGYFQMVDSKYLRDVTPDLDLPDPCTAIDTSYCVTARSLGYRIGISPSVVYHQYKEIQLNKRAEEITHRYVREKWGQFYFKNAVYIPNVVGKIPRTLEQNRRTLVAWQQERFNRPKKEGVIRLNIGCGETHPPSYINSDIESDTADIIHDMRQLPYKNETVDEISSHHSLEHIPYIDSEKTLIEFYRVLKVGGYLDIGIPDLTLCCRKYLDDERLIHLIYGWQRKMDNSSDALDKNQIHKSGYSKKGLISILEKIGFKILDSYNYDGNGTPSVWVFAQK